MKTIKIIFFIIFALLICVPTIKFNFEPDAISEIDNRKLTENPFSNNDGEDLTENIEDYVNDRIGFRSEMITAYTVLNDKLFNKMVHPSYSYGKEGYVFGAGITTVSDQFTDFHQSFANMVKEIENYCKERNIPFVFVFDPAKPAVLSEYVAKGTNYSRAWAEEFLKTIDEYGINYVDNTVTLKNAYNQGEVVFNKKYDANHWNDLGAYYGVNAILNNLKTQMPNIHINTLDEFDITQILQTSLPVSKFTINEKVPEFTPVNNEIKNIAQEYNGEIELNPSYTAFGHYINEERKESSSPKVLVFQGSYMNGMGYKFLANSFGEYIYVHDYQNVLNFDYYYNIFKPDCVIFEVAEYTFLNQYFDYEKMKTFKLQPTVESTEANAKEILNLSLADERVTVEKGKSLTEISWDTDEELEYVWLSIDEEYYDMKKTDNGYTLTAKNDNFEEKEDKIRITAFGNAKLKIYS